MNQGTKLFLCYIRHGRGDQQHGDDGCGEQRDDGAAAGNWRRTGSGEGWPRPT